MEYGKFDKEANGRLSGQKLFVNSRRSDGKFSVTHAFGSGARINKIYTQEQLNTEIAKLTPSLQAR